MYKTPLYSIAEVCNIICCTAHYSAALLRSSLHLSTIDCSVQQCTPQYKTVHTQCITVHTVVHNSAHHSAQSALHSASKIFANQRKPVWMRSMQPFMVFQPVNMGIMLRHSKNLKSPLIVFLNKECNYC